MTYDDYTECPHCKEEMVAHLEPNPFSEFEWGSCPHCCYGFHRRRADDLTVDQLEGDANECDWDYLAECVEDEEIETILCHIQDEQDCQICGNKNCL